MNFATGPLPEPRAWDQRDPDYDDDPYREMRTASFWVKCAIALAIAFVVLVCGLTVPV